jgi:hypothetical protein
LPTQNFWKLYWLQKSQRNFHTLMKWMTDFGCT